MTDFLQLHLLTAFGPSNLNRDDTGRPKSVTFGGVSRVRVSSQSLKRAWRTSDTFKDALHGHLAERTKRLGKYIYDHLVEKDASDERALEIARAVAGMFGTIETAKDKNQTFIKQLAFVSPDERKAAFAIAEKALASNENLESGSRDEVLNRADAAADIAMFGRMLAESPRYNREAAVQVAHAITTHRAIAEEDYYTAVDDLKSRDEPDDVGAGFLSVQEFGAGVFYLYVCVDRDLLLKNLDDNRAVWESALTALVEAAATVAPKGKQASFASRARALYVLAEKGTAQPRSLAAAFLKPVDGDDQGTASVKALVEFRDRLDKAYGQCARESCVMDCVGEEQGSLAELRDFVVS